MVIRNAIFLSHKFDFNRHAHNQFVDALNWANKLNVTANFSFPMNFDYLSGHLGIIGAESISNFFYGSYFSQISIPRIFEMVRRRLLYSRFYKWSNNL